MAHFSAFPISMFIDRFSVEAVDSYLKSYRCAKNADIEHFVRSNALDMERKGITVTYLVFSDSPRASFAGFFSLTMKVLHLDGNSLSKSATKRLLRFGELDDGASSIEIPAILIAQFGKNDDCPKECRISGDELMGLAIDKVQLAQSYIGGRYVYLECEDNEKLLSFYESQQFHIFGLRKAIDTDGVKGKRDLVRMIRYLK